MRKVSVALLAAITVTCVAANATVVTSWTGGSLQNMPAINYFGPGPQSFGTGITWSSTNASIQGGSVFGDTQPYGYFTNGLWDGALGPMAGLNDSSHSIFPVRDTMTFSFATPVQSVGGFINYDPRFNTPPTTIAVWDTGGHLIESYNLTFNFNNLCPVDCGMMLGFAESSAIIGSFTLTDGYIGIVNLTTNFSSSTPEPSSLLLLGSGAVGLFGVIRRKMS